MCEVIFGIEPSVLDGQNHLEDLLKQIPGFQPPPAKFIPGDVAGLTYLMSLWHLHLKMQVMFLDNYLLEVPHTYVLSPSWLLTAGLTSAPIS